MYLKSALTALVIVSTTSVMTGCVSAGAAQTDVPIATSTATDADIARNNQRIASLQQELSDRNNRVASLEQKLAAGNRSASSSVDSSLFPPNAQPGQCFARVLIPESYKSTQERVLAKEASARVEIIPAVYKTEQQRLLVKEASSRLEVIPATYENVTERVLVKMASSRIVEVPATYRTETDRVLDTPATTVWKKGSPSKFGNAVVSQSVSGTGEVMCLVEVPAVYKTVSRQVVATPAQTKEVVIPAEYKTVTRRVVKTPASTREVTIPAVYDTVEVRNVAKPASQRRIEIPAEYKTVTKTEKVAEAEMSWQSVLCSVNATPENIRELQTALDKAGYNPGGIDGALGTGTLTAVNKYAQASGIPFGDNYVPMEVLKKLRVTL